MLHFPAGWKTPTSVAWVTLAVLLAAPLGLRGDEPISPKDLEFFESRIRPVLAEHCYECHSGESETLKGALRLDTREGIRRGGESGPAVIPGRVDEGTLLDALRHETFEMPPDGKLSKEVIADFAYWIRSGAADPRDGRSSVQPRRQIDLEEGKRFWCFQPLRDPRLPDDDDAGWAGAELDRFLLAAWKAKGIAPGPDADRRTLLRRLYFDLIGLPPTPAQIEAFLRDTSPHALETVVDQLLDSPHFGERWGRHWLDVARYAESTGGGRTRLLYNAWRYRDYVVAALNQDKPYDRFVVEQIAGDLLPSDGWEQRREQLTATGFLTLGPINYELQDKDLLRMEIVDEQLSTIGRSFLAMTIGCARCHDHKFDPIPTRDYYALAGILRSTKSVEHANVSNFIERPLPLPPERQAVLDEYQQKRARLEADVQRLDRQLASLDKRLGEHIDLDNLAGVVVDNANAEVVGTWSRSTSVKSYLGSEYLYASARDHRVVFPVALPEAETYEVRVSYTAHGNRASNAEVLVRHEGGESALRVNQQKRPSLGGVFEPLGTFTFAAGQHASAVVVTTRDADGIVVADAVQLVPVSGTAANDNDAERQALRAERRQVAAERKGRSSALDALKKQAPAEPPQVMSVREEEQVEDCPLHVRGNIRVLGDAVPRGYLSVATTGSAEPLPAQQSGRLELARWIASPDNPLTARVIANRVWLHLFGAGIVTTPDNFGKMGEPPSHPELLDHLAMRLVAEDWSLKRLIRYVVLSRAYGLSSDDRPQVRKLDPRNRLCWRQHRRRLEAEAMRDAILHVSGSLDTRLGGSEFGDELKSEFGYEFTSRRRSVYVPVFRNTVHDLFEVFDVANPNLVSGRRNASTLPTQALYLMNSPFVAEQARRAAARLLENDEQPQQRLTRAYLQTVGRPPGPRERELAARYLEADTPLDAEARRDRWANLYQTLFACIDFRYIR